MATKATRRYSTPNGAVYQFVGRRRTRAGELIRPDGSVWRLVKRGRLGAL